MVEDTASSVSPIKVSSFNAVSERRKRQRNQKQKKKTLIKYNANLACLISTDDCQQRFITQYGQTYRNQTNKSISHYPNDNCQQPYDRSLQLVLMKRIENYK